MSSALDKDETLSDKRDTWNDGIQSGAVYEEKDVKEAIKKLKPWCVCGHRIDEHGRDNNSNLCAGCPCENPTLLWYRIEDVKEIFGEKLT